MSYNILGSTTQLGVSLVGAVLVYGLYKISTLIYNELTSPLRYVPGPPSPSLLYGSFKQLSESVSRKIHEAGLRGDSFLHRPITHCKRVGSSNTDRQSSLKSCLGWANRYWSSAEWFYTSSCFHSQVVLWPPIWKQAIMYFSTIMSIRNPKSSTISFVNSSEVVRFPRINCGVTSVEWLYYSI